MLGAAYITRGGAEEDDFPGRGFTPRELGRVGIAATMIAFGGSVIVLLSLMILMGNYSSLSHAGPKAVLDGAVIALLMGQQTRWRNLALLGVVNGLVLLILVGIPYLPIVLTLAGLLGAGVGAALGTFHRRLAILIAAATFEWCAGLGEPLRIYFGTADSNEPFLWGMWFAEWPLRIVGACVGVWLAWRWLSRRTDAEAPGAALPRSSAGSPVNAARVYGVKPTAIRLLVLLLAAALPLAIGSWSTLLAINGLVLIYALVLGPRRSVFHALIAVASGYAVFAAASYLWHHDVHRVVDLIRTFVLRFAPMMLTSVVLVRSVRPVDVLRVLRRARLPRFVLFPLAMVLRQIPHVSRDLTHRIERLRSNGHWTGPYSMLRHPRTVLTELLWRPLQRWAGELAE